MMTNEELKLMCLNFKNKNWNLIDGNFVCVDPNKILELLYDLEKITCDRDWLEEKNSDLHHLIEKLSKQLDAANKLANDRLEEINRLLDSGYIR